MKKVKGLELQIGSHKIVTGYKVQHREHGNIVITMHGATWVLEILWGGGTL